MFRFTSFVLVLVTVLHATVSAQQAAHLAPADAGLYIEVAKLAELRKQMADDPVVALLQEQMPHRRQPKAWEQIQDAMGLSGEEIFDRYFGMRVVVIAEHARNNPPGVLLSQVSEADAALAIEKLQLQHVDDVNGFAAYRTGDGKGVFAFGRGWMAMTDHRHREYAKHVIEGIEAGESLADDATFKAWTGRLPRDPQAMLFARDGDSDVHVLTASHGEAGLKVNYAGKSPQWFTLLDKVPVDATAPLTYGPLPASTLGAISLNLKGTADDPRFVAFIDRLLAGKSFTRDVMPKLGTPSVLWLSRVPGDAIKPAIDPPAPAIGLALHMADPAVAEDLQRIMEQLVVVFNVATMQWQTPPATTRTIQHAGGELRAADLGPALAQRIKVPQYGGVVTLTWGRVGEWFVVTTAEAAHRQVLEAAQATTPEAALAARLQAGGAGTKQPIAGGFIAPDAVADLLIQWMAEVEAIRPQLTRGADADTPAGRRWRNLALAAEVMGYYRLLGVHLHQPEAGVVEGVIELQRR